MMNAKKYNDSRVFMNTKISMTVYSNLGTYKTKELIEEAFGKFGEVVDKYTRFNDTSQLAKLNKSYGKPYQVSDELFELVSLMLELAKKTNYKYDPTVIDFLELYGYGKGKSFSALEDKSLIKKVKLLKQKRPHPSEINLDTSNNTITLQKQQRLDLGSIGKGFAVDLAAEALIDTEAFSINAGGDIRVKGPKPDGDSWQLGLVSFALPNRKATEPEIIGKLPADSGALAGSGGWARRVKFFHHLINTDSGLPANEVAQTYVLAANATHADLLATVLFVSGEAGFSLLEDYQASGLIITSEGKLIKNGIFKDLL